MNKQLNKSSILTRMKPHGIYSCLFLCVVLIILLCVYCFSNGIVEPMIFEGDLRFSYPQSKETISSTTALVILVIIPLVIIILLSFFILRSYGSNLVVFYRFAFNVILYVLYSLGFGVLCTTVLKTIFAFPRPDFFSRCGYPQTSDGLYGIPGHIANLTLCSCLTSDVNPCTRHQLADMYFSFPSGHSTTAASSIFAIVLIIRFLVQETRLQTTIKYILYSFVYVIGIILAFSVAGTRVYDHRHSTTDITAGLIIGFVAANALFPFFFELISTNEDKFLDRQFCCLRKIDIEDQNKKVTTEEKNNQNRDSINHENTIILFPDNDDISTINTHHSNERILTLSNQNNNNV